MPSYFKKLSHNLTPLYIICRDCLVLISRFILGILVAA
jgi:hypothetical protein